MIVVDASAIVDYLLEFEPQASWVARQLMNEPSHHAPYAVDVEVLTTLRLGALGSGFSAARAGLALEDFHALPIRRYPQKPFLDRAWELRANVSAPDALYVALAETLEAPLITTDERLGRSKGHRANIVVFPE